MADWDEVRFWGERKRELERKVAAEIDAGRPPRVETCQALLHVRGLVQARALELNTADRA